MKTFALLALSVFLSLPLTVSPASALTVPEKLVYDVSWTGVTAATAVHEIKTNGNDLHITATTRSAGWINAFYAVNDRSESVVSRGSGGDFGVPKSFRVKVSEGNYRALKEARFDPENQKVEAKDLIKKTEKVDTISARTFDSLSSIYYIRSMDLVVGKSVFVDIYDCKRLWKTEVQVVKREEVETPVGRFKTVVVKPLLKAEGFFANTGEITVWLTDDNLRIPVKMTTKVKLGKITATLVGGSYWPKNG